MSLKIATNDSIIFEFLNDENYQVTETGKIFTKISKQGHQLSSWREKALINKNGYKRIRYHGKLLQFHRIVYAKATGILDMYKTINHIDGNPSNNHISNLELVSYSENNTHRYRVLKHPGVKGFAKISQSDADEIRKQVAEENKRACDLARQYNLSKSNVSAILNNKTWKKSS